MKLRADFAVRFMVSNIRKEILIVALLLLSPLLYYMYSLITV